MVSNKLSVRRAILKRPIVCRKPPPPPPPGEPTPPPPDWPPDTFDLHFTYNFMEGPYESTVDYTTTFTLSDPPGNLWIGDQSNNEANQLEFSLDDTDETGDLIIGGDNIQEGGYTLESFNIPINWGSTATYIIETWLFVHGWMLNPHADFNF